jgi:cell division protein FtsQ
VTTLDTTPTPPAPTGLMLALLRWLVALLVVAGSVGAGAMLLRMEPSVLPVRVVTVDGAVHRLSAPILARSLTERLDRGILTQDLRVLKDAVEALPWVHSATLRRVWPDQIALSVTEHQPIARWGDTGLVTAEGVVFRPEEGSLPPGLPRLIGDDAQAPQLAAHFLKWRNRVAVLRAEIATLALDPRGAWTLYLDNGVRLELGTERVEERLERFIRTYPQLAAAGRADLVDVRYANGLAVRWAAGAAPGDVQVAQTEPTEPRAPEARAVRTKAPGAAGDGRNKSRNKG